MSERIRLLDLPLDTVDMDAAAAWIGRRLTSSEPAQVVTLNPEIAVRSRNDTRLKRAIEAAELVTPDGVGILWATKRLCGLKLTDRVTGVDLTHEAFSRLGKDLRVYFLGGQPGVAEQAAANSRRRYGVTVAGFQHGYFDDSRAVVAAVRDSGANLLLAGLGERQEVFLHENKESLGVPVMIGVGGTLDVLAGKAKRMPAWSRRLRLEWLLRVGFDPRRWPRAWRLASFAAWVWRQKPSDCRNR